jgi:hypothetical protein
MSDVDAKYVQTLRSIPKETFLVSRLLLIVHMRSLLMLALVRTVTYPVSPQSDQKTGRQSPNMGQAGRL